MRPLSGRPAATDADRQRPTATDSDRGLENGMDTMLFDTPAIRALIELAIAEDVGTGDLTTMATVPPEQQGHAVVRAKQDLVICGLQLFGQVMRRVDPAIVCTPLVDEGGPVTTGTDVIDIRGPVAGILIGERPALNFIGRTAGIATATRACVDAVAGHRAVIVDTRKTLPGYRALDKYAVRMGGGRNHRTALDAGILIKENHIRAAGSITAAIRQARAVGSHLIKVEVEVEDLAGLDEALAAGAELILLDNMDTETLRAAVSRAAGRALLEASGNMVRRRLAEVAATGVDLISMGALTHSVVAADLSLRLLET